ncbi:hypothetical protein D3C83_128010 [compost metagenome]
MQERQLRGGLPVGDAVATLALVDLVLAGGGVAGGEGGEGSRGDRKGGEDSDGTHGFCMLFSLDLQREIITQACPKSASQVFGGESQ